jgi:hypothetical protein
MQELAARFNVLQNRFIDFSETIPTLLRLWLSRHATVSIEVTTQSLLNDLLLIEQGSTDGGAPLPWVISIAHSALCEELMCVPFVQLKGSSVIFSDILATLSHFPWPIPMRTRAVCKPPDDDHMALIQRNAFLEVRVAELESNMLAVRGMQPLTASAMARTYTAADTLLFLQEKRFEAEDAIATIKKLHLEHAGRVRVLESIGKEQMRKLRQQARTEAEKARRDMAVATNEILRMDAEIAQLRSVVDAKQSVAVDSQPITPKRALVVAGFWNVSHNDVLSITPYLVAKFEEYGGKAIRRKNEQICFSAKDRKALIKVVAEVMAEHLPGYAMITP